MKGLTEEKRMIELANLPFLTTKQIAEVASVGRDKALKIRNAVLVEIQKNWDKGEYEDFSTFRVPTEAVFDFLGIDRNKYRGEEQYV